RASSPVSARAGGVEATPQVLLAGPDRCRDGIAPPWGGTGVDRVVGAIRVAGSIEVEAIASGPDRHQLHEAAGGVGPGRVAAVAKEDRQLRLVRAGRADSEHA